MIKAAYLWEGLRGVACFAPSFKCSLIEMLDISLRFLPDLPPSSICAFGLKGELAFVLLLTAMEALFSFAGRLACLSGEINRILVLWVGEGEGANCCLSLNYSLAEGLVLGRSVHRVRKCGLLGE